MGEGNPDTSEAGGVLSVTQMHCWFNVSMPNMSKLSKNAEENLTCLNYWEKKNWVCYFTLNYPVLIVSWNIACMHYKIILRMLVRFLFFKKREKTVEKKLLRYSSWFSVLLMWPFVLLAIHETKWDYSSAKEWGAFVNFTAQGEMAISPHV